MSFPCPGDVIRIGSWTRKSFFYPFVSQKVFPLKSKYFQVFYYSSFVFSFSLRVGGYFQDKLESSLKKCRLNLFCYIGAGGQDINSEENLLTIFMVIRVSFAHRVSVTF